MNATTFFSVIASPAGLALFAEIVTLLLMLTGLSLMVGWRRAAGRLASICVATVAAMTIVVAFAQPIGAIVDGMPKWMAMALLGAGASIALCWVIWGVIALCFGPAIASRVTAEILTWLLKGIISSVINPYRIVIRLLRQALAAGD